MDPGRFDTRATILRRAVVADADGDPVGAGAYAPVMTLWASYRPQGAREAAQGGRAQNVETGTLTIRDSAQARTVTNADRVALRDRDFNVTGIGLPDRRTGTIQLTIATDLGGA
ncbi:head-tail adaptor protein [Methylobacterium fujisawaense]|uniref:Head-tail adaptor n=1 Tax=Methylobacterium fujisawaense TaxID=107400 RepID=A0ABR6D6R8_9HYPH|nr:head-tail adaptor protein [Methylobacterium fujisawaense]MBA9061688.1 head-tail adaptor [Methylobacterium fujisawaense]